MQSNVTHYQALLGNYRALVLTRTSIPSQSSWVQYIDALSDAYPRATCHAVSAARHHRHVPSHSRLATSDVQRLVLGAQSVTGAESARSAALLVGNTLDMAHTLGAENLVKGVADASALNDLMARGVDYFQGP